MRTRVQQGEQWGERGWFLASFLCLQEATVSVLEHVLRGNRARRAPSQTGNRVLALMLALIEGLSFGQIGSWVLQEVGFGVLAAKAVGLALDRRVDGAIRCDVFVISKAP